jgi:S1-C subfamily serine protease
VAKRLGIRSSIGLFIAGVDEAGPANAARIRGGDLLFQVDRSQVTTMDDLGLILETIKPGAVIRVMVLRLTQQGVYRLTTRLKSR